ncbi:MAG TPA: glutaminase [Candidatus Coprenecus merdipullorum]|nr:glutaminase [Candidatus Coprenecus merdipullorum]
MTLRPGPCLRKSGGEEGFGDFRTDLEAVRTDAGTDYRQDVGSGISAYIPGNLAITVWNPELNRHGSSLIGVAAPGHFTTDIGNSIF